MPASKPKNIVQYSRGLGVKLYPVQRFITKLCYNIQLSDREKDIAIHDMFRSRVLYRFTELGYLHYLFNEGRCNISEQDHIRRQCVLNLGKRSGKDLLSSIFASYDLYRLLSLDNPQRYYGLSNGSESQISISIISTGKDQAGLLFNDFTSHISRCRFFRPYLSNNTLSYIKFRTSRDIKKYGPSVQRRGGVVFRSDGASVTVHFRGNPTGVNGSNNLAVFLSDAAHFQGESDLPRGKYPTLDPHKPTEPFGPQVILVSSPMNKSGSFYESFKFAMSKKRGSSEVLAIQAPTWEVNETVSPSFLRERCLGNPQEFMRDYGAQFQYAAQP